MPPIDPSAALKGDQVAVPVRWVVATRADTSLVDVSDAAMAPFLGPGRSIKLKSFGHDADGVHFLLTRSGSRLHTDPAYARYSHQLVLRNDGNRLRGFPYADEPETWHPPLVPGVMYAIDTHSPHQGLPDPRFIATHDGVIRKAVVAVDRDELLTPGEAFPLLARYLSRHQLSEVDYDPTLYSAPRFRLAAG